MLPWIIAAGVAALLWGNRAAASAATPVTPAGAPLTEPADTSASASRPNFTVAAVADHLAGQPGRLTVQEQVSLLPNVYFNPYNAGDVATRPGVPDPVAFRLQRSRLGLGGDFL